jgi:hypothetical protein
MADDQENPYETERWIEKTSFPIGVDLTQAPPEMRYQLLGGRVFTLQLFPSGDIARGELAPADLDFPAPQEGWYDGFGAFLGDEPNLPTWE